MPQTTHSAEIAFSDRRARVEVTKLPGRRAVLLLARLGRLLGPGLAAVAGKASGPEAFAPLVAAVLEKLSDAEFDALSKDLLDSARVATPDGQMVPVLTALNGQHFVGEPIAILAILAFALRVNFQDFSSALASIGEAWKAGASFGG